MLVVCSISIRTNISLPTALLPLQELSVFYPLQFMVSAGSPNPRPLRLPSWIFQDSLVASAIFNGVNSRQEEAQIASRDSSVPGRPPDPAEELCDGRVAVLSVGEHVLGRSECTEQRVVLQSLPFCCSSITHAALRRLLPSNCTMQYQHITLKYIFSGAIVFIVRDIFCSAQEFLLTVKQCALIFHCLHIAP